MNYRFQVSPSEQGYQYELSCLFGNAWKNDSRCGFLTEAEALALQRTDIDLPADQIRVRRTLNKAGYVIPLNSPGPSRILVLPPVVRELVRPRSFENWSDPAP